MLNLESVHNEVEKSLGNWKNWKNAFLFLLAVALLMIGRDYWDGKTPPYTVKLNPNTDYAGYVYLYDTLNYESREFIRIPVDVTCYLHEDRIYTIDFDPPLEFYRLDCRGAKGYVQTNKVILP